MSATELIGNINTIIQYPHLIDPLGNAICFSCVCGVDGYSAILQSIQSTILNSGWEVSEHSYMAETSKLLVTIM